MPQTEADYSNFITTLMDSQHKMLTQIHGVDSPQVALSSTLLDLQGSVRFWLHFSPCVVCCSNLKALTVRCTIGDLVQACLGLLCRTWQS